MNNSPNWAGGATLKDWCQRIPKPKSKPMEHIVPSYITHHPNKGVDCLKCPTQGSCQAQ